MTLMIGRYARAAHASLALALCLLVLAASSFTRDHRSTSLDDGRQPAAQSLNASTVAAAKPANGDDHDETPLAAAGRFSRSDPRPALDTLDDHIFSKPFAALGFQARAPPSLQSSPVIG